MTDTEPVTLRSPVSGVSSVRLLKPFQIENTTVWAYTWEQASALYYG